MLAFPSILVDLNGGSEFRDGTLFSLPPELSDQFRIAQYLKVKEKGWTKSEFGYYILVNYDSSGQRYILPGLFLTDATPPIKKIPGYKAMFTKALVEAYLSRHLAWENTIRKKSEEELTALVHDLRHLSGSIYHSALEAENAVKVRDWPRSSELLQTVIASQTMLKVRIDYLDFANSVDRFDDIEEIPVYSRVDKVIRCFRASAKHKNIDIFLSGASYRLAKGPNILDIVPYTIVENAIKYAPNGTNIEVNIEDTEDFTSVFIRSVGPKLDVGEIERIFQRGYRGRNAISAFKSGTGLGLSVAASVIDIFAGSISAFQEEASQIRKGIPYCTTIFMFKLPTSGEDNSRRMKFSRLKERRSLLVNQS